MSNNDTGSSSPTLKLDNNDNPHIAWMDRTKVSEGGYDSYYFDIFYTRWNGNNWVCANGATYAPSTRNANVSLGSYEARISTTPSLSLDSNDKPNLAWSSESVNNSGIFYVKHNGSNWICVNGSTYNPATANANVSKSVGGGATLGLDSNNNPHIAWHNYTYNNPTQSNKDIAYLKWSGSSWVNANGTTYVPSQHNANVSNNIAESVYPTLSLDNNNNPHLIWKDSTPSNGSINSPSHNYDINYVHYVP